MRLTLGGAGPYGPPAHQVGDILRGDDVEKLRAGRHPHFVQVEQQAGAPVAPPC